MYKIAMNTLPESSFQKLRYFANKTFQGFTVWQSGGIK